MMMEAWMSEEKAQAPGERQGIWAGPVDKLDVANVPEGVTAINIQVRWMPRPFKRR